MSSVRLYAHQVEYLKQSVNGASVIAAAVKRYRRGDFATYLQAKSKKPTNMLQTYSIAKKPPIPAALLREVLELHLTVEDEYLKRQVERDRRIVSELEKTVFSRPYIIEDEI
jgi:hypothetical protein